VTKLPDLTVIYEPVDGAAVVAHADPVGVGDKCVYRMYSMNLCPVCIADPLGVGDICVYRMYSLNL
jgi:hypothetical protein